MPRCSGGSRTRNTGPPEGHRDDVAASAVVIVGRCGFVDWIAERSEGQTLVGLLLRTLAQAASAREKRSSQ